MPDLTLKPGEDRNVPTSGLFLSIVEATGKFQISHPTFNVIGEVGRKYELPGITSVMFKNESESDVLIEYESANIKVDGSGKGVVTVGNEIVVKKIVEAIQVNATSTVENGKMSGLVSNRFEAIASNKKLIASKTPTEIFPARAALNRKVVVQLITDSPNMGEIRLGTSAENVENGIFIPGHKDAPGGYELKTETAVFVYNPGNAQVEITGGEAWRA